MLKPFGANAALMAEVTPKEAELLALVGERPVAIRKVAVSSAAQRALASLKRKGLVQTGGFTPSDAAHVLGLQDNWPGPAAELAAKLMVRFRDMRLGDEARVQLPRLFRKLLREVPVLANVIAQVVQLQPSVLEELHQLPVADLDEAHWRSAPES